MKQDILISVIVPVYNVEKYLPKCVDSILNQTYRNLEVILVDDGTKDASDAICDAYAQKDPRVKVIHKENGGLSSARNAGIDIAQGEYLGFVDSDDWIEPDMYETLLSLAEKYRVKMVCGGRFNVNDATGVRTPGLCPPVEEVISGEELVSRIFLWDNIDSAAWDKLYHHSLFREIRYPLGKIVEDVPTTYRIALAAGKIAMCDKHFYNYLYRENSITTAAISEKTFHFAEHTKKIYPFICESYPQLKNQARYLRVRSLIHSIERVEQAQNTDRKRYAAKNKEEQKELRKHTGFLLNSPYFDKKAKLRNIMLAWGLYRLGRRISRGI